MRRGIAARRTMRPVLAATILPRIFMQKQRLPTEKPRDRGPAKPSRAVVSSPGFVCARR